MKENHSFSPSSEKLISTDGSRVWVRCNYCQQLVQFMCANYECPKGKEIKNENTSSNTTKSSNN